MTITETTTIADIASELPTSVRVFQRHGIDFCCGGQKPIGVVCREHGLDFVEFTRAIEASRNTADSDTRDWSREPLSTLTSYIVTVYHQPLREELPRLKAMAERVARVQGGKALYLERLEAIVAELCADLLTHMRKEEMVLFPAIEELTRGATGRWFPIDTPIAVMEHEHDHAGSLLEEMRVITAGYHVPEWACATTRALYQGLAELESAMHVHVHLENNVLLPRALDLMRNSSTGAEA